MSRILIVNNNLKSLDKLRTLLEKDDHRVTAASDSGDALKLAKKIHPDLIVADLYLPVTDGYELYRQFKSSSMISQIPFIFYTESYNGKKDKNLKTTLKGERLVLNPEKPQVLKKIVNEVLEERVQEKSFSPLTKLIGKDAEILYKFNKSLFNRISNKVKILEDKISGLNKKEKELKFNNIILNTQMETSIDGILAVDECSRIIAFNKRFTEIWDIPSSIMGLKSDEHVLKTILSKLENPDHFLKRVRYLYKNKKKTGFDEILFADGRLIDRYSAPMIGPDGKYYGRLWYFRDVTKRIKTEKALAESEEGYRRLIDSAPIGISIAWGSKVLFCNNKECQLFGYDDPSEIMRHPTSDFIHKDDIPKLTKLAKQIISDENTERLITFRGIKKDGSELIIEARAIMIHYGDTDAVLSFHTDITEHKHAEKKLEESEARYRSLFDAATVGIIVIKGFDIVFCNQKECDMLGFKSPSELKGHSIAEFVYKNDIQVLVELAKEIQNKSKTEQIATFRAISKDGRDLVIEARAIQFPFADAESLLAFNLDVTERIHSVEALKNSEALLKSIFDASPAGLALISDRGFLNVNNSLCRISGYSEKELVGKKARMIYFNDEEFNKVGLLYKDLSGKNLAMTETILRNKNGGKINALIGLRLLNPDNPEAGVIVTVLDITDHKRAEEALKKSDALLKSIFDASPVGIVLLSERVIMMLNNSLCRITGYSEKELMGKSTRMLYFDEEEFNRVGDVYMEIAGNAAKLTEAVFRKKDGSEINVLLTLSVLDPDDFKAGVIAVVFDVTDLKKAEKELEETKVMLNTAVMQSPVPMVIVSAPDNVIRIANNASLEFLGVEDEKDKIGKPLFDIDITWKDQDENGNYVPLSEMPLALALRGIICENKVCRTLRKDGTERWESASATPILNRKGEIIGAFLIFPDITVQKQAEEKLLQSLQERETLIRELYHRTKNTMQIIRSMLVLQAEDYPENEEIKMIVKNTEDRIQAISLVHQMLYKSQNLSKISIKDYIKGLTSLIFQSFGITSDRITLDIKSDDQFFLLDTAIPFGLILNELMTNSLKYAFPGNRKGMISISLTKQTVNRSMLFYQDNGVGVPDGFVFRNQNTFGLQLIYSIGEQQMMGSVVMENDNGISCRFEFPNNLYEPRV